MIFLCSQCHSCEHCVISHDRDIPRPTEQFGVPHIMHQLVTAQCLLCDKRDGAKTCVKVDTSDL